MCVIKIKHLLRFFDTRLLTTAQIPSIYGVEVLPVQMLRCVTNYVNTRMTLIEFLNDIMNIAIAIDCIPFNAQVL